MYRYKRFIYIFCLLLVVVWSCNPTRDRWVNREWHTMTGHFNVFFNGEQKLLEAVQAQDMSHTDDFTKILDVFTYGNEATAKATAGQMDAVLKKASISIQKHTIGRYTDDSYMLMGKAHFFKQDYYASMEAFQYINSRYKTGGLRPIATTWIAKCYVGLKKPEEAEAVMGLLLSEYGPKVSKGKPVPIPFMQRVFKPIPNAYYREMYATAADIAIRQSKYTPAIKYLENALKYGPAKKDRIRYTYIVGQLYLTLDSVKQANKYFTNILKMNAPYAFEFNASINIARAYDPNDRASVKRVRNSLRRMLRDDKNDGFYDQIHYELGKLEQKEKNIPEAIKQFKLSAAKSTKNQNQKALAYLALGNIYLDMPDYKLAQAYYDSTAMTISTSYKDYQKIMDKKAVLSDLISNLVVIETQDSLQRIAKLNKDEIEKKIDEWIVAAKLNAEQKAKDEKERKEAEKRAAENPSQTIPNTATANFSSNFSGEQGQWYFYNAQLMAQGATEFFSQRKWGKRPNEDFWRLSSKEKEVKAPGEADEEDGDSTTTTAAADKNGDGKPDEGTEEAKDPTKDIATERQAWITDVPFTKDEQEKSNAKVLDAYFNIGLIYDEKLSDYNESVKNYETLLKRFPGSSYEPEVLYRLYKAYMNKKDSVNANRIKEALLSKYPQSPYAKILQNKALTTAETAANKEVVAFYEKMYGEYEMGHYAEVKQLKQESERKFPGNAMQAKFDLLNAMAIGKTDSLSKFKAELQLLVKDYPKTDVAERAQQILDYIKEKEKPVTAAADSSKVAAPDFVVEPTGSYYYIFATKGQLDNNEAVSVYSNYNEEYASLDNLRVNNYVSNEGYQLIMVSEFPDLNKTIAYMKGVQSLDIVHAKLKFPGEYLQFAISKNNFKKMLKEQKVDAYNKVFQEYLAKNNNTQNNNTQKQ